jgi:hypothetical protein
MSFHSTEFSLDKTFVNSLSGIPMSVGLLPFVFRSVKAFFFYLTFDFYNIHV